MRKLFTIAAMFATPALAASFGIGSSFDVTTNYSSTGNPCEADCWETWQTDIGMFMVVKDANGRVVDAGRITEAYFQDLFLSVDEASRKIPIPQRITRYGTVRSVTNIDGSAPNSTCAANCLITVDFGYFRDVAVGFNAAGKIGGAGQVDDAALQPIPQDRPPPPGFALCSDSRTTDCIAPAGGWPGLSVEWIAIWAVYDKYGNLKGWIVEQSNGHRWFKPNLP